MTATTGSERGSAGWTPAADPSADALVKAATLIEALPWLERLHGKTVVIKFGGHAMADPGLCFAFAQDVVFLRYAGLRPVIVHGGGPQIDLQLDRLGVPSTFRAGLRVTTQETMDVVRMVLTGSVNRDLVGLINRHGPFAMGMSGEDANLLTAARAQATVDGEAVDLGQVGRIEAVDPGAVRALIADGRIPVISSVARGSAGEIYNVNADTAAGAIAVALGAEKLILLTDVAGLYADWPPASGTDASRTDASRTDASGTDASGTDASGTDAGEAGSGAPAQVISSLSVSALAAMLPGLSEGMIPKMEACVAAVRCGVPRAHVLDGRLPHAVLLEIFTDSGIGTMVLPDELADTGDPADLDGTAERGVAERGAAE